MSGADWFVSVFMVACVALQIWLRIEADRIHRKSQELRDEAHRIVTECWREVGEDSDG